MSVLFRGKKDEYYGPEFAVLIEKYNDLNKILLDDVDKKNYGEYNCHCGIIWVCISSSIGRAPALQAGYCGFKSRLMLHTQRSTAVKHLG